MIFSITARLQSNMLTLPGPFALLFIRERVRIGCDVARKYHFANKRGIEYLNQSTGRDGDEMKMNHLLDQVSQLDQFSNI